MKRIILSIIMLSAVTVTVFSQNFQKEPQGLNWKSISKLTLPTLKPPTSSINISVGQCGATEGCSTSESDITTAITNFINCMNQKMDVLIDESAFERDEVFPPTSNHPGMYCWGYAHHCCTQVVLNPVDVRSTKSK